MAAGVRRNKVLQAGNYPRTIVGQRPAINPAQSTVARSGDFLSKSVKYQMEKEWKGSGGGSSLLTLLETGCVSPSPGHLSWIFVFSDDTKYS